jgi:hypothetical protein
MLSVFRYFMISQPEFVELCAHFAIPEATRLELEDFYDGFQFKVGDSFVSFYNNESLINYLDRGDGTLESFRSIDG